MKFLAKLIGEQLAFDARQASQLTESSELSQLVGALQSKAGAERVRVAHKGPCLDSAELAMEDDGIPFQWMELTVYLWRLTESSRLTET